MGIDPYCNQNFKLKTQHTSQYDDNWRVKFKQQLGFRFVTHAHTSCSRQRTTALDALIALIHDVGRHRTMSSDNFTCKLPCREGVSSHDVVRYRTTSRDNWRRNWTKFDIVQYRPMWTAPLNQCVLLQRHRTTPDDIVRHRPMSCAVWTLLKSSLPWFSSTASTNVLLLPVTFCV